MGHGEIGHGGVGALLCPPMHTLVEPVDDLRWTTGTAAAGSFGRWPAWPRRAIRRRRSPTSPARAGSPRRSCTRTSATRRSACPSLYARATDQVMGTVAGAKQAARDEGLPWRDRVGRSSGVPGCAGGSACRRLDRAGRDPGRRAPGAGTAAAGHRPVRRPAHRRRRGAGRAAPRPGAARQPAMVLAAVGGSTSSPRPAWSAASRRLPEDADVAADVVIGLLERRD